MLPRTITQAADADARLDDLRKCPSRQLFLRE